MIEAIAKLPRVRLGCYPTPLVEAKHLSEVLGGPRILIKRDDLSGLALGGNKCRHLEFLMADAKQKGFDAFVLGAATNLSTQLTAAAAKLNFKVSCILYEDDTFRKKQGNYLLHKILNPDMRVLGTSGRPTKTFDDLIAKMNAALENEAIKLRKEGYNPFVRHEFECPPVAAVGWVNAADEIWQQLQAQSIKAQYLIVTTCQGGTHSGLAIGAKYFKDPFKVIGISNLYARDKAVSQISTMSNVTTEFLNLGVRVTPDEIIVYDEYKGESYSKITKESIAAIKLIAQTEGFFLDPLYTGKCMAGLIDLIHKGQFTKKDTVVFIHTGGIPYLFVYPEDFTS